MESSSSLPPMPVDSSAPSTPSADSQLCEVCCETVPPHSLRGCSECPHRFCVRCIRIYWEGLIFSGSHARIICMFGGCGATATDEDVRAVVSERTFRRMRFFRERDIWASNPNVRFCPKDGCWALVTSVAPRDQRSPLICKDCRTRMCFKCEAEVDGEHHCAIRKIGKAHRLLFELWATCHTKTCPECNCRIQRSHGCSHMTCARCNAYFCWRCRGFLHNDCPKGRTCICDRIMTGAAYSGLFAAAIIGAPVIITGAVVGGAPYLVYRLVKRKQKSRSAARRERGVVLPYFAGQYNGGGPLFDVDARTRFGSTDSITEYSPYETDCDSSIGTHEIDGMTAGDGELDIFIA